MNIKELYDVIIVGSGAAGGIAAYDLTLAGKKVLMLEIGRNYDPQTETAMFQSPEQAPLRGFPTDDKPAGFYDATVNGGFSVSGEPYTVADGSDDFVWWRPRMLGGRTNHWGRVSLRFGKYDFKPRTRDGLGYDWPISYEDIAPWYDAVEEHIGVTGKTEHLENSPDSPEGILLPPPPLRVHELVLSRAFKKLGAKTASMHAAILTKPHKGRPECMYATQCTRGCSTNSNFQSTTVLIPQATATGNLTTICNASVYQINVDKAGKAKGVNFFDTNTNKHISVNGKTIVLAAGAFSSTRILLNSKSETYPDGIGNSSGFLGKYILDSVEYTRSSYIPMLEKIPPQNDDGMFAPHIYIPWWLYQDQKADKLGFRRGYHIEPRGGRRMPTVYVGGYVKSSDFLYGNGLREKAAKRYASKVFLTGEGEMIPNEDCFCELDPDVTDKWGVPVLRFHWKWGEEERNQWVHMHNTFNDVFKSLGGNTSSLPSKMPAGGSSVHESGGARMGFDKNDSVVDSYGRCWDCQNVFVLDSAIFTSMPDKNPTLTILALAKRGANQILKLSKELGI